MFSRRHPFLFFLTIISACMTLTFLGLVGLIHVSSKMMDSEFTGSLGSERGNIGIVEVIGPIMSSKKIIEDIKTFRENDDIKAIIIRIDRNFRFFS